MVLFFQMQYRCLRRPTLFCHKLEIDTDGFVADYKLRQPNQKQKAVEAFRGLNYKVIAAGDSFNDTTMLGAANAGFLFHAPDSIKAQFPQFQAFDVYADLLAAIKAEL
jgi:phosphoserine/homoserine phosphotransferase